MITDWLMVLITTIYVVATIAISKANIKSANATREQLAVSKQQFEETKRLGKLPYLSVEFIERKQENEGIYSIPKQGHFYLHQTDNSSGGSRTAYYMLHLTNIGCGAAKNIKVVLKNCNIVFKEHFLNLGSLGCNSTEEIYCQFEGTFDEEECAGEIQAELIFEFHDLLGNKYHQSTFLKFYSGAFSRKMYIYDYSDSDASLCIPTGEAEA